MLYVKGFSVWHIQKKGPWMYCGRKIDLTITETSTTIPLEVFTCSQCLRLEETQ